MTAYVSGHGFGHSTRTAEVLRAVRERAPGLDLAVVTSAPESLYRDAIPGPFAFRRRECDVGLAQQGALVIDEKGTLEAWHAFERGQAARIAEEAGWLEEARARLVLGDIPPLAFEAAALVGIPSVALANFSWDWIYRHLARRHPGLEPAAETAARAYGKSRLLLELPFAGDLAAFPRRQRIPLVARKPAVSREEARARLDLPREGPIVLLSFGGLGLPGFRPDVLAGTPEVLFLMTDPGPGLPGNVRGLRVSALSDLGLGYADLVTAADVVVTKPGYGIVSDAIAAGTRMLYTDRGDFPEYPILVDQMARWMPSRFVSHDDLRAGRLGPALRALLDEPYPGPPDLSGAEVAAGVLVDMAR